MKALLTNDDGIQAEGLSALRAALLGHGFQVVVVAPTGNRSGLARACTPRKAVSVEPVPGDPNAFACNGTPVDCIRIGLLTDIATDASVVLSGINHGANLGDDTLYSATVGAALEAALLGRPALALSQQPSDGSFRFRDQGPWSFERAALLGAELAVRIFDTPPPGRTMVNVNVPPGSDGGRIEVTRLGRRPEGVGRIVADGAAYFLYGLADDPAPPHEAACGTDFHALAAGAASATPFSLDWDDPGHAARLLDWLAGVVDGVELPARKLA